MPVLNIYRFVQKSGSLPLFSLYHVTSDFLLVGPASLTEKNGSDQNDRPRTFEDRTKPRMIFERRVKTSPLFLFHQIHPALGTFTRLVAGGAVHWADISLSRGNNCFMARGFLDFVLSGGHHTISRRGNSRHMPRATLGPNRFAREHHQTYNHQTQNLFHDRLLD